MKRALPLLLLLGGCSFLVDVEGVRKTRDAGGAPVLNADRASLDFGSATVGAASAPAAITLTNNGTAPMGALTAEVSGAGAGAFVAPDLAPCAELAPGASCVVEVGFTPPSAQAWSATLTLSAAPGGAVSLLLSGTGVVPGTLAISPALTDFGQVTQGGRSAAATFVVRNTGTNASGALAVELTGVDALQFDVSVDGCSGQVLAPGASCELSAGFAPGIAGPRRATLTVTGAPGGTAVAALTGLGIAGGSLALSPSARVLSPVPAGSQGAAFPFQLANTGAAATGPVSLEFSGTGAPDFELVDTDCRGATLQPTTTCAIRVRFAPVLAGQKLATLVAHASPGGSATASLSATAQVPAALEASPTAVDFGTVLTTVPATATVQLKNAGALLSGIPTVALTGVDAAAFAIERHDCTGALQPSASCTITLRFAPTAPATLLSAGLVASAAPGGSVQVALSGKAVTPGTLDVTPTTLNFGSLALGATSPAQVLAATNIGGASTPQLSTTLGGASADQFTVTMDGCNRELVPLDSCNVSVAFAPTSGGSKTAHLTLSAPDGGLAVAQLVGRGLAPPQLTIDTGSVDLGSQVEGQAGRSQDFRVENLGDVATSTPLQVSIGGPGASAFSIVGNGCSASTLTGGTGCTVTVQFTPPLGALGPLSATLTVAPQSGPGGTVTASLAGTGLTPSALSFTTAAFGASLIGTPVTQTFTLRNNGGGSTGPLTVSIGGGNASDFQVLAPIGADCVSGTTALAGGTTCTVRVRWTPGARGIRSSSLTATASPGGTAIAPLTGTGQQQATLTASNTLIGFSFAEVGFDGGTRSWVVTNAGDVASGTPTVGLAGTNPSDFTATGCSGGIDAGASCTVTLGFKPTAVGTRAAQVQISATPGTTTPLSAPVQGEGRGRLHVSISGAGLVSASPIALGCDGGYCTQLYPANQQVVLRAISINGWNAYFREWRQGCTGPSRTCNIAISAPSQTVVADFPTMQNNLAFVSSVPFGNLAPDAGQWDRLCNVMASDAGINLADGGGYVAWVSTATSSPVARLGAARGFIRVDGQPVADQLSSLTTTNQIFNAIMLDETGTVRDVNVRTATDPAGTALPGDSCSWWTSGTTGTFTFGTSSAGPIAWTANNRLGCATPAHIYCFGKTKTAALTPVLAGGKRMWVTDLPYFPNTTQTPNARCAANRPAGVANGIALLGRSTAAAGALLLDGGTYVRPDGQIVGTTTELRAQTLRTAPWQSANAQYVAVPVWTGYGTPLFLENAPPVDRTCTNWTSTTGAAHSGQPWFSTTRWFAAVDNASCADQGMHLICIEP